MRPLVVNCETDEIKNDHKHVEDLRDYSENPLEFLGRTLKVGCRRQKNGGLLNEQSDWKRVLVHRVHIVNLTNDDACATMITPVAIFALSLMSGIFHIPSGDTQGHSS